MWAVDYPVQPKAAMVLVGLTHDWLTRGRPHAVLLDGGLLLIVSQMTCRLAGASELWARIAGWLVG